MPGQPEANGDVGMMEFINTCEFVTPGRLTPTNCHGSLHWYSQSLLNLNIVCKWLAARVSPALKFDCCHFAALRRDGVVITDDEKRKLELYVRACVCELGRMSYFIISN